MASRLTDVPTVNIAGFEVADLSRRGILEDMQRTVRLGNSDSYAYLYLHVGGLLHAKDAEYVAAANSARLIYADGISVVSLARIAGARSVQRAPTTDTGLSMLTCVQDALERRLRVAIIGGPPGLAERAGVVLEQATGCELCYWCDGYRDDYASELDALRQSRADVLVLGLGVPLDAMWLKKYSSLLDVRIVMACGGWLGFLTGEERRAPMAMRKAGLEWLWRAVNSPTRLSGRYLRGFVSWGRLAVDIARNRKP